MPELLVETCVTCGRTNEHLLSCTSIDGEHTWPSEVAAEQRKISHALISQTANRLPFVLWDRLVDGDHEGEYYLTIYGWIARSDGQRDFVTLTTWSHWETVDYLTSSAKYSKLIGELLYGGSDHNDCKRVADSIPGVKRSLVDV